MQVALANPDPPIGVGPSVGSYTATAGSASVDLPGTTTTIDAPHGSIFDWQNFDIGYGHTVNHVDYGIDAAVLHRVNVLAGYGDGAATGIFGNLNAPGNLFVVNPMGIVIGPQAYIEAQRFVASGLNITNFDDFIADPTTELKFQDYWATTLGVEVKEGAQIFAEAVGLIGRTVSNSGTITSDSVMLVAGEKVYLTATEAEGKILVQITNLETSPNPAENFVNNTGTIDADGGNVLLAAGDVYSLAISGVGSLAAVANGNITLDGDFEAGEMTITADYDGVDGGYVYASGTSGTTGHLTSTTGDIEISASDNTWIQLNVNIDAAEDLLLNNNTMVTHGKTFKAGQDVILADSKTMKGYGALTIEGDRDIILGGAVHAYGTMTLKADADTVDHEQGAESGGIMLAKSTLGTIYGNIDIYGNAILLDNDVSAHQDLILNNDTIVKDTGDPGITLRAGNNVDSPAHLTAEGNLRIVADGGAITAHEIKMPAAPAPDATLTLTQNDKLDMEQNVTVINRTNTHLVATSTADSVTSAAAAKWMDITATADENITLSDESGDITTLQLTATNGDVKITANDGKLFAEGNIDAGRDVVITATDEGFDGSENAIFLGKKRTEISFPINVNARQDILLNNNTWAADGVVIDAGRDVKVGWDAVHEVDLPKTLTGEGALTVEADRHITLGGDVKAGTVVAGNLMLKADAESIDTPPGDNIGNMTAKGDVINENGNIDIYSSDDTTFLGGSLVRAVGDITLHNNTVLNGTDDPATPEDESDQRIDAESGLLTAMKDVDKSTPGSMT
ncbi:MAG: filamentous hemagglutinin N-terminal domain-containing protein, partial [Desulfobacteraceae bacterium]|nr:filamentous hemagglutinin N-terminal domain-containing protein [Desulfobacteraceae bacterium]